MSSLGVHAVGVDVSGVQVAAAAARWGSAVEVHHAGAAHFLCHTTSTYDAIFSVFGPTGSRTRASSFRPSGNDSGPGAFWSCPICPLGNASVGLRLRPCTLRPRP
ncbi:hypothetical protein ABZW32_03360 [Streptomyces sp. NPDC004667]|uniref:hypothetical protein n=1 Tax=Streptomyces sp. NPDC004667 TaxID=3154285 RepID=UPI0033A7E1A9